MHSFRQLYSKSGPDDFYIQNANKYKNPHELIVQMIVSNFKFPLYTTFLDLGCGGGEVTMALQSIGYTRIKGLDPYTFDLYTCNTGIPAYPWSFQDVAYNFIDLGKYDVVIASFSLHLCPKNVLKLVCLNLALVAKQLIIISPHKNPVIHDDYGWILQDAYTIDRVHTRVYKSMYN